MATATRDPLQTISERLDKQDVVLKGLLEAARTPASKAGVSPQEWLAGHARKDGALLLGPQGIIPMRGPYKKKSYLGQAERLDGQRGSFGEFLINLRTAGHHEHIDPAHRAQAMMVLKSYGTEQYEKPFDSHGYADYIKKTALAESSAITGGYTVMPPLFSQQLYEIAIEDVIIEPRARKQPLTTRQAIIPALDQVNATAAAVAGQSNLLGGLLMTWTAEAATRKESEPVFRNVVGTAWEGSFYALASNTLLADSAIGLDNYLTQLFGRAVGFYTDLANFQGNGVGQPLGVINAKAAIQVTRSGGAGSSTLSYADICNMMGKLYWINRKNRIAWVIHPTVIPKLLLLNDNSGSTAGTGRLVFQPIDQGAQAEVAAPEGAQSCGNLMGYPVLVSEKVPALGGTGDVGLYDFDAFCVFKRMDMEIAISTQVNFLQNQTAWRVVIRQDGQPLLSNFVTYADAGATSTASTFVVLK